jgi:hypothetical protein
MKRTLTILCVLVLLLAAFVLIQPAVSEETMTDFDGVPGNSITYPGGGGKDVNTQINIERKSQIFNATFKILGKDNGLGFYPTNVTVDIGDDGDNEWAYRGEGYGSLGYQTMFNESEDEFNVVIGQGGGFSHSNSILLPKGAVVTSADMDVTGVGGGFHFKGGGLMVKLVPTGAYTSDSTCTQVCYATTSADSANKFVQQWYNGGAGTRTSVISGVKFMRGTTLLSGAIPNSPSGPSNCIPFGSGAGYGPHQGFIYKNMDEFILQTGDNVCFDVAAANDANCIYNIYLGHTTTNGGTTLDADGYTQVCFAADGGKGSATTNDWKLKFAVSQIGGGPGPENATVNIGNNGGTPEWSKSGADHASRGLHGLFRQPNGSDTHQRDLRHHRLHKVHQRFHQIYL